MGQVPNKNASYLIIGRGKLSRHLQHYFSILNIRYQIWHRELPIDQLHQSFERSDIVLLAINDAAILSFIEDNSFLKSKPVVHFSGANEFENLICCHPLMTFAQELFSLNDYQNILFVTTPSQFKFQELFPQLKNKSIMLQPSQKSYYHALCVMTSNFPNILWSQTLDGFHKLGIPKEFIDIYLQKTVNNFIADPKSSLTGPLVRGDQITLDKNKQHLDQNMRDLYIAFEKFYTQSKQTPTSHLTQVTDPKQSKT